MTATRAAAFVVVLFGLGGGSTVNASAANWLDSHRWAHRLLLVFSPASADRRAHGFEQILSGLACELEDRDLVVASLPLAGEARFAGEVAPDGSALELRQRFQIGDGEFAVVLVGKDGGAKLRVNEVPDIHAIFDLIDGMPMRIAEMRESKRGCSS